MNNFEALYQLLACPVCKQSFKTRSLPLQCNTCQVLYPDVAGSLRLLQKESVSLMDERKQQQVNFYTRVGEYMQQVSSELGNESHFNYLNFGYLPNAAKSHAAVELPTYYMNRNSARLTLEVVGNTPLEGKTMAEIGCGFGGNLSTIHRFFSPAQLVGMDLCLGSVQYCNRLYHMNNIDFVAGDAEQLPFRTAMFDVIFNLESSHAYPDKEKFYQEVFRVLKPGGYFLYSDNLPVAEHFMAAQYLTETGFSILRNQDITANVLLSCDQIAGVRERSLSHVVQAGEQQALDDFVATPDSQVYSDMKTGKRTYKIMQLQKTNDL